MIGQVVVCTDHLSKARKMRAWCRQPPKLAGKQANGLESGMRIVLGNEHYLCSSLSYS